MGTEIFLAAVGLLLLFAIFDLVVGVSNDAVNFLNSSLGSRAAPRHVIMIVASLGILCGVLFSSGMMEVARKGIFYPQLFTMPELMFIFLAVMIADVILLDLFNTFGLPTSTTVSIVFELLGAAVAVSCLKLMETGHDITELGNYINTGKAMVIISGILLSVAVSFVSGAVVQFLTRLLFTFDYQSRMKRWGALWGGAALTSICYFILVKGAKGSTFLTKDHLKWIAANSDLLMAGLFVASVLLLFGLQMAKVNILKPIVIIGTFALALAFAANDLVNFIGVPLAGLHAYQAAVATDAPLTASMSALNAKVRSEDLFLILAGVVMVLTLWFSRKARSVTETEIGLSQQDEGPERFGSSFLSRSIVAMALGLGETVGRLIPEPARRWMNRRLDTSRYQAPTNAEKRPSFDLLRAGVNLMVASVVVSYATSHKLPLSTTYVTFMVAMGTSFSDQAWGRESAVYRVTGVLTVIGGWFMTALMAFTTAGVFGVVLWYGGAYGGLALLLLAGLIIWRNHHQHQRVTEARKSEEVFNLKHITDATEAARLTSEHVATLVNSIRSSLDISLEGLFTQNEYAVRKQKQQIKRTQIWANIIIANVFKVMRLIQKRDAAKSHSYAQAIRRIQKLADGYRDLVARANDHVANHHKGLLDSQVTELRQVKDVLLEILESAEGLFGGVDAARFQALVEQDNALRDLGQKLNESQVIRIQDDTSKTRLTILYYAVIGDARMLSRQVVRLVEIFHASFGDMPKRVKFDLD